MLSRWGTATMEARLLHKFTCEFCKHRNEILGSPREFSPQELERRAMVGDLPICARCGRQPTTHVIPIVIPTS
jgi:hypothetical protein